MNKGIIGIEEKKTEFEVELCKNDNHIIAKMYKLLLRLETEGRG